MGYVLGELYPQIISAFLAVKEALDHTLDSGTTKLIFITI